MSQQDRESLQRERMPPTPPISLSLSLTRANRFSMTVSNQPSLAVVLENWLSVHLTFNPRSLRVAELADFDPKTARFIGRGDFGTVSTVRRTADDKTVAIKAMFNIANDATKEQKQQFDREYQVALEFPHWTIVNVFNYFRSAPSEYYLTPQDGTYNADIFAEKTTYFTMEACRSNLKTWLRDRSRPLMVESTDRYGSASQEPRELPFDPATEYRQALLIALQLLLALEHLDRHRIRHLDIKLDNLLVGEPRGGMEQEGVPQVLVGDFGTSEIGVDMADLPSGHVLPGNVCNRSPEVLFPRSTSVDIRHCDKWAIGCVIFEILEGHHPFLQEGDNAETLARIRVGDIPPVSRCWKARPGRTDQENRIKSALDRVVSSLLHRDVSQRGPIDELITTVERALWPIDTTSISSIKAHQAQLVAEILAQHGTKPDQVDLDQPPRMTIEQLLNANMLMKQHRKMAFDQVRQALQSAITDEMHVVH